MTEQPPPSQPQPHPFRPDSSRYYCADCGEHHTHHEQGQPQRNPLRAALERFGRERGQPQPQSSAVWPSDTTAASPDEVERRRRADSTAIEQSQPQPSQWERDEQESRDALARGEGITFENAEQAIKWLQEPQQEPSVEIRNQCDNCQHHAHCAFVGRCIHDVQRVGNDDAQERQAGGHVHERGMGSTKYGDPFYLCVCGFKEAALWWDGYEAGVADAAAQP